MPNEALKKTTLPKITFIGAGSGERLGVQPTIEAATDRRRAKGAMKPQKRWADQALWAAFLAAMLRGE